MHAENRSTIIIPHFRFDLQCGKTKQKIQREWFVWQNQVWHNSSHEFFIILFCRIFLTVEDTLIIIFAFQWSNKKFKSRVYYRIWKDRVEIIDYSFTEEKPAGNSCLSFRWIQKNLNLSPILSGLHIILYDVSRSVFSCSVFAFCNKTFRRTLIPMLCRKDCCDTGPCVTTERQKIG